MFGRLHGVSGSTTVMDTVYCRDTGAEEASDTPTLRHSDSLLTLRPDSSPSSPPLPHEYPSTPLGKRMIQLSFLRPPDRYPVDSGLSASRISMNAVTSRSAHLGVCAPWMMSHAQWLVIYQP
jgi:hypothetical protein